MLLGQCAWSCWLEGVGGDPVESEARRMLHVTVQEWFYKEEVFNPFPVATRISAVEPAAATVVFLILPSKSAIKKISFLLFLHHSSISIVFGNKWH